MTSNFEMFLLVCEEMNFTRAAERIFVTQQCLSEHIKRLESQYHVILFNRRPRLSLTPAGESMLQTVRQIQALEKNLQRELNQYTSGVSGEFRFGINTTRGQVLFPEVFAAYHQLFPSVKLSIINQETMEMEKMLCAGTLDAFLGVNTTLNPMFQVTPITRDQLYLAVPDQLLRRFFPAEYPDCIRTFCHGIDLKLFEQVPMVSRNESSTTAILLHQHTQRYKAAMNNVLFANDFATQLDICAQFPAVTTVPRMVLPIIFEKDKHIAPEHYLHVFPIKHLEESLSVDLISRADVPMPLYACSFLKILEDQLHILIENIDAQLKKLQIEDHPQEL